MDSGQRVPDELLLEVFSRLPPNTLKEVALASRTFNRVSFPFRFRNFAFQPHALNPTGSLLLPPSPTAVIKAFSRLEFWSSDGVAPLVRSCQITAWGAALGPVQLSFSTTHSPYVLRDAVFECLPKFRGLKRIRFDSVHFTLEGINSLCEMPALTHLNIEWCQFVAGERLSSASQKLRVASFTISDHHTSDAFHSWLPLLHPDCLRELDVAMAVPFHLFGDVASSFPRVHTLSASIGTKSLLLQSRNGARFPGVKVFVVRGWSIGPDAVVQCTAFPMLTDYTGPRLSLPMFATQATLTRLTVWACPSEILISQLREIQISNNITALDVAFTDFDRTIPRALCAFFPRLTELRFGVALNEIMKESFFQALADPRDLPTTLIALRWEFRPEYEQPTLPDTAIDFEQLREGLVARCPALAVLYMDGHQFAYRWHKTVDGRVEQRIASNAEDAKEMREIYWTCWA
ncbi:hypothetical protein C8R43DRAFT_40226 [Mycena crocata]|nr:hypothetical protein C8R43DRAFT_40226 [Mycena crocata]